MRPTHASRRIACLASPTGLTNGTARARTLLLSRWRRSAGRSSSGGSPSAEQQSAACDHGLLSLHVLASVDGDVSTRDEGRLFACKVGDEPGNLRGLTQPTHGNLRKDLGFEDVTRNGRDHRGTDVSGRNGIDRDALARDLERQSLAE